jgi:hypothetical protein
MRGDDFCFALGPRGNRALRQTFVSGFGITEREARVVLLASRGAASVVTQLFLQHMEDDESCAIF